MVTLRCQDCGKVVDGPKSWIESENHECGGSYAMKGSEDDGYEPNICPNCGKDSNSIGDGSTYDCDECGESVCGECDITDFENVTLCKKCVDKAYPRESRVVEKVVEKVVEVPREVIKVVGFSEPIL